MTTRTARGSKQKSADLQGDLAMNFSTANGRE
jgi:hypothetical protein